MDGQGVASRRSARGFTLVESLTVLAASAALLTLAVPSVGALAGSMRLTSAANDLLADILFTRAEALKRRVRVVLCKSADGLACMALGGWHQGWIVFVDDDGDGLRAPTEAVLQRQPALGGSVQLVGNGTVSRYLAYAPDGATRLVGGGFQAGTFTVCRDAAGPAPARQIVISASGRPRVQKVTAESCA